MGLFEQFPYTNFHELNLDWLLKLTKATADDLATLEAGLDARIAAIASQVQPSEFTWKDRKLVSIGDSYAEGYTADGYVTGYPILVKQFLGISDSNFINRYNGGAGLTRTGNTFKQQVDALDLDVSVTDVLFGSFCNDWAWGLSVGESDIRAAVSSLVDSVKAKFPNAKIYFANCGFYETTSNSIYFNFSRFKYWLINACAAYGVVYLHGVDWAFRIASDFASDNTHPTSSGQNKIAVSIATALNGTNPVTAEGWTLFDIDNPTGLIPNLTSWYFQRKNDAVEVVQATSGQRFEYPAGSEPTIGKAWADCGEWANCPFDKGDFYKVFYKAKCWVQTTGGLTSDSCWMELASANGHLYIRIVSTASGGGWTDYNDIRFLYNDGNQINNASMVY